MSTDLIKTVEARIVELERQIGEAKEAVQSWVDANSNLSHSAAAARAKIRARVVALSGSY